MVCVNKYLLMEKKVRFNNMFSTIILMGYLILAALFTSLLLSFSLMIPQQITFNQILPTLLSYMMGNVVGVLLILPLSSNPNNEKRGYKISQPKLVKNDIKNTEIMCFHFSFSKISNFNI